MSGHTRIGLMTSDDAPELGWSFVKFQAVCLVGHPGPGIRKGCPYISDYQIEIDGRLLEMRLVERVQVMIIGADVDDPISHHWRGDDTAPRGVAPELLASLGAQRIELVIL